MESSTTFRHWWISNTVIYKRYFVDTKHTVVNLLKCKEKNCSIQCNTSGTHFGIALNHTQTWSYTVCHKRTECDKFHEQYIKSKAQKASHFHSTSSRLDFPLVLYLTNCREIMWVFFSFSSKHSFLKLHSLIFSVHILMDKYSHLRISHSWQKLAVLLVVRREAKDCNGMALLPHKCDLIKSICRSGKFIVLPFYCFNTVRVLWIMWGLRCLIQNQLKLEEWLHCFDCNSLEYMSSSTDTD